MTEVPPSYHLLPTAGIAKLVQLKHRRSAKPWIFLATAANETIALKSSPNKTGGDDYG